MTEMQNENPNPEEDSMPKLRLRQILEDLKNREGNYSKLELAIEDAIREPNGELPNREGAARAPSRRKLKSIVDNDPKLVLSIGELRGLDVYLERFGHGLAYDPLFEKPEVMRSLAEFGPLHFMLGSKLDPGDRFRTNISHWDLLALNRIQTGVMSFSQNVHIDIQEVQMRKEVDAARDDLDDEALNNIFGDRGPSVVCLGSIRGNQMAEWMLCGMAGLSPFQQDQPAGSPNLPFQFLWDRSREYVLPSPFHLYGEDANDDDPVAGTAVLEKRASGFRFDGRYVIDELSQANTREGYTYALCAAQRREHGQIWLLVAGLTGPATFAASKWVHKMPAALDDNRNGGRSRVFWHIVRAKATKVEKDRRETYRVGEAEVVAGGVDWG
jgi:hypothetical protein